MPSPAFPAWPHMFSDRNFSALENLSRAAMDQIPAAMDRHLDVLRCHRDGGLLLGASSLTGRYWLGSLWFYASPDLAPDVEKCTAGVQLEAGLRDAQWADNNKVLVGLDDGGIALWGLEDDFRTFTMSHSSLEHDGIVASVSVCPGGQQAVSAAYDKCVKVWDLKTFYSIHTYRAHADVVWSVSCHPQEQNIFLSCSQDGRVIVWDTRKAKPASIVDKSPLQYSPTSSSWHPDNEHIVAVADETGTIMVKDIRKGVDFCTSYTAHSRFVQQVQFCPFKSNLLASVGEDCRTVVVSLDETSISEVVNEMTHTDFAHGLTWCNSDKLFTCGWDGKVNALCPSKFKGKQRSVVTEVNGVVDHEEGKEGEDDVMEDRISYSDKMKTPATVAQEG